MLSQILHNLALSIEENRGRAGIAQDKRIVSIYESYKAQLDANDSIATAALAFTSNNENANSNNGGSAKPPFILLNKSKQTKTNSRRKTGGALGDAGEEESNREAGKQIIFLEKRAALLEKRTGMMERSRDQDVFAMQRENAKLISEMHELQKTNITLKRQIAASAKQSTIDANGEERGTLELDDDPRTNVLHTETEQKERRRIGSAMPRAQTAAPKRAVRQRPKSASVIVNRTAVANDMAQSQSHAVPKKKPMTGSVFRAMRAMSSVDNDKLMMYMNRVEEQEKACLSFYV